MYKRQLLELKKICKSRGLIISGKKDDVIIRLMENDELNQQPPQSIQSSYAGTMPIQSNSQIISGQNVQRIYLGNKGSTVYAIGTIVIIYGSFRMLMALLSWLALGVVIGVVTTVLLMNWYNTH